ncbi:MAG: tetratricopeptide repeat protein [Helicobacteraceae bacterium]|nr:tetratricopeptide repeat protein [Helicobacteraceae bacterium]
MKLVFFLLFLSLSSAFAEPSVFGAGDISKPNPYGLTSSEKHILNNKNDLKQIAKKNRLQSNKVDSLTERLDGLQSIFEGMGEQLHSSRADLKVLKIASDTEVKRVDKLETIINSNVENITKLKIMILELSSIIDTINISYVSKDELNKVVKEVNEFKALVLKEFKKAPSKTKSVDKPSFSSLSNAKIATEARDYYDEKFYTKAIERYDYLLKKKYQPARANYMLGEMHYYRKKYKDAISYFKESATLYDKASYMPTLMLHTAVAMQRVGDNKNAESFFNAILAKYPDTDFADKAQKRLLDLK